MRDLKFRAWDHVDNVMLFADFGELQDIGGEWTAWDLPIDSPTNTGTPFEVMQFTGLTDKNGVEIYEGDIIKLSDDGIIFMAEVEYDLGGFCVNLSDTLCPGSYFPYLGEIEIHEVIGNIHENTDLLCAKK